MIERVPDKDWLAESRRGLPEFKAGPFFFYGSHFKGKVPKNLIGLEIDAGMAFGTGRHETTKGCLLAVAKLAKTRRFKKPLDVGTGTGILAFGVARLCKVNVLAGDNDADAVRVAKENAAVNKLSKAGPRPALRRLPRQGDPRRRAVRSGHGQHPRQSADRTGARSRGRAGKGRTRGAVRPAARAGEGRARGARSRRPRARFPHPSGRLVGVGAATGESQKARIEDPEAVDNSLRHSTINCSI